MYITKAANTRTYTDTHTRAHIRTYTRGVDSYVHIPRGFDIRM